MLSHMKAIQQMHDLGYACMINDFGRMLGFFSYFLFVCTVAPFCF